MQKLKNNSGETFSVLSEYFKNIKGRQHSMWLIQFEKTGTTLEVYKTNAEKGKAKDPYSPSFLGRGYSGEIKHRPVYYEQARRLWSNMLKRCYDPNYAKGYYGRGYSVCERWMCFANFLVDLPELENFNKWLECKDHTYKKYNLDKDTIVSGNKVYSKETCMFLEEHINKAEGARNGKPYTRKPKPEKNG